MLRSDQHLLGMNGIRRFDLAHRNWSSVRCVVRLTRALANYERILQPERRQFFAQYRLMDATFKAIMTDLRGLRISCLYYRRGIEGAWERPPVSLCALGLLHKDGMEALIS